MKFTMDDLGRALIYRTPDGQACGVWLSGLNPAVDDEVRVQFHPALGKPDAWVRLDQLVEPFGDAPNPAAKLLELQQAVLDFLDKLDNPVPPHYCQDLAQSTWDRVARLRELTGVPDPLGD